MPEILAMPIAAVTGVTVPDNGQVAIIRTTDPSGQEVNIAVPQDQLMNLALVVSQAVSQTQKILQVDRSVKHVIPCEWWEFGAAPDGQNMILSFRMPGGLEMSFQVHKSRATPMIDALSSIAGHPTQAVPPGTTRQ